MKTIKKALASKLEKLNHRLQGEISMDQVSRMLYATDASIYQQLPLAVAYPHNKHDCKLILQFCEANKIPLIPRAGGTSLAGQVVGKAIIVDVSRHMTRILSLDVKNRTATVEPGVVIESLNQHVAQYNLKFAPDPSTLNRATISGVIGNNAWGAHAPIYGSTRDHILTTEITLTNGESLQCSSLTQQQLTYKLSLNNSEGEIYRKLTEIIGKRRELINRQYPTQHIICNTGYALHKLSNSQPWCEKGPLFNLSQLLCGSEGTLAFITQAEIKLVDNPQHSVLLCAHFNSLNEALTAVPLAVDSNASAVELLDNYLIKLTSQNIEQSQNRFWIKGQPRALLLIEFCGDNESQIHDKASTLVQQLQQLNLGFHFPLLLSKESESAWAIRRASLGLLMGMKGGKQTPSFIEDSAVPVRHLAEFIKQVQKLMKEHKTQCVYYGSVSMGLIHLRPLLNLHSQQDIALLSTLANEVAKLLIRFCGTMSAKHGDGRVRGPYIQQFLGRHLVDSLSEIKHSFDPRNILNPGKIVNPLPMQENLRFQQNFSQDLLLGFNWTSDAVHPLLNAVERCNGAAVCRKHAGNGVMCPSYMATGEELHSTRGRANIIRQLLQHQPFSDVETVHALNKALDLCISCKGCRTECPANVDMARLKSEIQYQINTLHGIPRMAKLLANLERTINIAAKTPNLSNKLLRSNTIKKLFGFHKKRDLPQLATTRLSRWHARHSKQDRVDQDQIIILNDLTSEYYDVDIAQCAIQTLEKMGFNVILSPCLPSLRTVISQGMLDLAKERLIQNINHLHKFAEKQIAIVGLEPSELLTYRDEAIALNLPKQYGEKIVAIANQCFLFEEFMLLNKHLIDKNLIFKNAPLEIVLHEHCHQKSLCDPGKSAHALQLIPNAKVNTIPSGCCGMAGAFGYEQNHYDTSKAIAELVLLPFIRQLPNEAIIVATGTSCRQQIKDLMNKKAYHSAQIFYRQLVDNSKLITC